MAKKNSVISAFFLSFRLFFSGFFKTPPRIVSSQRGSRGRMVIVGDHLARELSLANCAISEAEPADKTSSPEKAKGKKWPRGGSHRGSATRQLILDAAERCLADSDFDGVPMRMVAQTAGVDIALLPYHFGSKENLLREVFVRRAHSVLAARLRALEAARETAGASPPTLEAIVDAFLRPWLTLLSSGDVGWISYNRLVVRISLMPKYVEMTGEGLDTTALHFINALRASAPKASTESIYWAYMFMVGAMIQVMARTGRVEKLSHGRCDSTDMEATLAQLIPFIASGIRGLEGI